MDLSSGWRQKIWVAGHHIAFKKNKPDTCTQSSWDKLSSMDIPSCNN